MTRIIHITETGIIKWRDVEISYKRDVAIKTVKTERGNVKIAIAVRRTAREVRFSANNKFIAL